MENLLDLEIKSVTRRAKPVDLPLEPVVEEPDPEEPRLLNAKQKLAWDSYVNPKSKTFGNGLRSALHAGYQENYASTITTRPWWVDKVRRLRLLSKAEKVLEEMVDMPVQTLEWEGKGEDAEQVVVTNPALVKIKQDTGKFLAERLGKDEGYSSRSEVTGAGGAPILVPDEKQKEVNIALLKFLDGK